MLLPIAFARAQEEYLYDVDGNRYLDFASGLTVPCGHAHPDIVSAVRGVLGTLDICEDYTTPQRAELTELLDQLVPGGIGGVQYYSSGAEAVEAGLRFIRKVTGRSVIVGFTSAYHGKTAGAQGLADGSGRQFVQLPFCSSSDGNKHLNAVLGRLKDVFMQTPVAGVVLEPVQGHAGVILPHPDFLQRVAALCAANQVLFMVDEVLTGAGRTGRLFAYQHYDVVPDVIALGKGLGNGLPVSAAMIAPQHQAAVAALEGGTSFGGNPVSCAAAVATLRTLTGRALPERAETVGKRLSEGLRGLLRYDRVRAVRVIGSLAAVEFADSGCAMEGLEQPAETVRSMYRYCAQLGLLTTPGRNALRLSPPLIVKEDSLEDAIAILVESADRLLA